jgi:glycosyltransferase involved in cell wall biosynthesis
MENNKNLTIVLPVYNGGNSIIRILSSLAHQTSMDFKLIIVNNNSNDGTKEICEEFNNKYNWIELIDNEKTIPMAENWNKYIECTDTGYVAMIHADDYYDINFISSIKACLANSNPDLILFNANIVDTHQKITNKLRYTSSTLSKEDVLEIFPGIQRNVWKRSKIVKRFNGYFFPIFDYVWFYENIKNVNKIDYLDEYLVNITSDKNQTTNKVSWEAGIVKALFYVLKDKNVNNFKSAKNTAKKHLLFALKSSIYKRYKKLKNKL